MRIHRFLFRAGTATTAFALLAASIVAAAQDPSPANEKSASGSGTRDPFQSAAEKADADASKKAGAKADEKKKDPPEFIRKTDAQWKKILHPYVYAVTREKMTEPAGTGEYAAGHFRGIFACACCDAVDVYSPLFSSQHKFDSGTGWPSFWRPYSQKSLASAVDLSNPAERRIEVMCRRCGAHLGHVFDDNPAAPTGLRFCINSLAIKLKTPDGKDVKTTAAGSRAKAKTRPASKTKAKNAPRSSRNSGKSKKTDSDGPGSVDETPGGSKTASPRS